MVPRLHGSAILLFWPEFCKNTPALVPMFVIVLAVSCQVVWESVSESQSEDISRGFPLDRPAVSAILYWLRNNMKIHDLICIAAR